MPGRNLNLLSLDGGGVRGLSSLVVLKRLMENIGLEAGLEKTPRPCDYFDMIGGTSTGGLIAIMLGRLKMTVDECLDAYAKLADAVFVKMRHRVNFSNRRLQGRFDSVELERAVKEIIVKSGSSVDELLKDDPDATCKVFVCATSQQTSQTVCLASFRRNRGNDDQLRAVKIWQAARATSAASTFFEPISIDMGTWTEQFMDGATGANNPVREVWNEAKEVWRSEPLEANLNCLVSIGTGVPSAQPFADDLMGIGQTLKRLATETENTAESFQRAHSDLDDTGRYFRFNVQKGLENIGLEAASEKNAIIAHTTSYVQKQDTFKRLSQCAKSLAYRDATNISIPTDYLKSETALVTRSKNQITKYKSTRSVDILSRISSYRQQKIHRRLACKRIGSTGTWFLKRDEFKSWLNGVSTQFLWLSGIVGSGKTLITTLVIEAVKDRSKQHGNPVIFYYCEYGSNQANTTTNLLRALIKQLLEHFATVQLPISAQINEDIRSFFGIDCIEPDCFDLTDLFAALLNQIDEPLIIVDGLDVLEYAELEKFFDTFRSIFQAVHSKLKLLIASRMELHHNVRLTALTPNMVHVQLEMTDVQRDIEIFIKCKIDEKNSFSRRLFEDKHLYQKVVSKLLSDAKGMFLWVSLQIEALWQDCFTDEDIHRALEDLPQDLDTTYKRCLDRIARDGNISHAAEVFKWIGGTSRPLYVEELKEAIAVDFEAPNWSCTNRQSNRAIISRCSNLVVLDPVDECVRFTHPSVQQYLTKYSGKYSVLEIDYNKTKLECGENCIRYLKFSDFSYELKRVQNTLMPGNVSNPIISSLGTVGKLVLSVTRDRMTSQHRDQNLFSSRALTTATVIPSDHSKFRFLSYAVEGFVRDTKSITSKSNVWSSFNDLILNFNSWIKAPWSIGGQSYTSYLHGVLSYATKAAHLPILKIIMGLGSSSRVAEFCNLPLVDESLPAIHFSSRLGYYEVTNLLLSACDPSILSMGYNALHYACENHHSHIVDLLVSSGKVDGNSRTSQGNTPILTALNSNRTSISIIPFVEYLETKRNADVDMLLRINQESRYRTLEVLLRVTKKDNINKKDVHGRTALHLSAGLGQRLEVDALIRHSVTLNPRTQFGDTPLHLAAMCGHTRVTESLLRSRYTDVNATCTAGWKPLHMAAKYGSLEIARVLAPITKLDDAEHLQNRQTPLVLAITHGHVEVAEMLLRSGFGNIDARCGYHKRTALHCAVDLGLVGLVKDILYHNKHIIDRVDSDGDSSLHLGAQRDNEEIVQTLLFYTSVENITANTRGETPLHLAILSHKFSIQRMLLEHCEQYEHYGERRRLFGIKDRGGDTAMDLALKGRGFRRANLLLEYYDKSELLMNNDLWKDAFWMASECGNLPMINLIVSHLKKALRIYLGFELGSGFDMRLVLFVLAENRRDEKSLVKLIQPKALGEIVDFLQAWKDARKNTPLHLAIKSGSKDIVNAVLDDHATIKSENKDGETPLSLVLRLENKDILSLILEHNIAAPLDWGYSYGDLLDLSTRTSNLVLRDELKEFATRRKEVESLQDIRWNIP